jgi:hypothetical protein
MENPLAGDVPLEGLQAPDLAAHYDVEALLASEEVEEDIRLHPSAASLYAFPDGEVRVVHKKRKSNTLAPTVPVRLTRTT